MAAPKGNRNAAKGKDWESALRRALAQHESRQALTNIALKVVNKALEGDMAAIKEIGDRLDGKAAQSIDLSGSIETREAGEMSDAELERIAQSGGTGTTGTSKGTRQLN